MIVIGYQGIGKSTLAKRSDRYIDLESGSFWVDGVRAEDWYKVYCNIAEHLSKQGYIVFVSSHEVVRNRLACSSEDVVLVYPSIKLRDAWIARLNDRYLYTGLEKDYKALMNALDNYATSFDDMERCNIDHKIIINTMNYDLEAALIHHFNVVHDIVGD